MTSRSTQNNYASLSAAAPVLQSGGTRYLGLDGSSNAVTLNLTAPVAGSRVIAFATDTSNTVKIAASSSGTIEGNSSETITLESPGDAIVLLATASTWIPLNLSTVNIS